MKASSLGVDWHLPDGKGGFRKRRFATTTQADSAQIVALADTGLTVAGVKAALNYPSTEQTAVLDAFITAGYADTPMTQFVA